MFLSDRSLLYRPNQPTGSHAPTDGRRTGHTSSVSRDMAVIDCDPTTSTALMGAAEQDREAVLEAVGQLLENLQQRLAGGCQGEAPLLACRVRQAVPQLEPAT